MKPIYRGIGIILTLCLYGWLGWNGWRFKPSQITIPLSVIPPSSTVSYFRENYIPPMTEAPMVHVSSICELSDGRMAAVWYGGSREGAKDVTIYFSLYSSGINPNWSVPQVLINRETASKELNRYIRKVGNPILFNRDSSELWLVYVTTSLGGWATSSLNLKISYNDGKTWTPSERLTLSPFFNLSELVKDNPFVITPHQVGLPIYHECLGKFPEILWMEKGNNPASPLNYMKTRISGGRSYIQPSIINLDSSNKLGFLRNCGSEKKIGITRSSDNGLTWTRSANGIFPNPDSGLDSLELNDGTILLIFNDSSTGRENLRLAVSKDKGNSWIRYPYLENESHAEFSYPYLYQGRDGMIHLTYTWKRKQIKHLVFNTAWLEENYRKGEIAK